MHSIIGKCSFINWCQKVQQDHHGDWQPQQQWQRHHQHQHGVSLIKICTGWPKSKFANSNGYTFENTHIWSHIGKAKMCFRGLHLFSVFSCLLTIFKNKCRPPKNHFGFTNMGSENHTFRDIVIWISKIWFGSPCMCSTNVDLHMM